MWEPWFYGLIAAFIVVMIFYAFTPFINTLTSETYTIGNFTNTATNTSFHNLLVYNSNMWNLWPIAAFAIIFILLFYFASEEDEVRTGRF